MAGPEPYPQVKWTREQEDAYAEGRASAKGETSKGGSAPRSGSKRKRYVRTQAGANRYHVPIGAEIGTARNAKGAQAQKDTRSVERYQQLVGADARAQAEAMQGLRDDQVQRLAQVAYSFKSSNPDVVRLRMGVAAELKRRGFNVNDFGGLGGGSTRPAVSTKKKPVSASSSPTGGYYRMVRERKLSVPQLRKALGVFSKISPDRRKVVAKYLVGQAIELGVPHMLGKSIIELASPEQQQVIELSGSWKHGWIPLNATAVSEKMKGNTGGKQWWSGASGTSTRRAKTGVVGQGKTGGKYAPQNRYHADSKKNAATAKYLRGSTDRHLQDQEQITRNKTTRVGPAEEKRYGHVRSELKRRGLPEREEGSLTEPQERFLKQKRKRKPGVKGNAATMRRSVEAGNAAREAKAARREITEHNRKAAGNRTNPTGGRAFLDRKAAENKGKPLGYTVHKQDGSSEFVRTGKVTGSSRTDVVKSGPKSKEAPMDLTGRTDTELNTEKRAIEGVAARKQPTKEMQRKYAAIKAELARRAKGNSGKA